MISILCQPHNVSYPRTVHKEKSKNQQQKKKKNTRRVRAHYRFSFADCGRRCYRSHRPISSSALLIYYIHGFFASYFVEFLRLFWAQSHHAPFTHTHTHPANGMISIFPNSFGVRSLRTIFPPPNGVLNATILSIEIFLSKANCRTHISDEMQTMNRMNGETVGERERKHTHRILHSVLVQNALDAPSSTTKCIQLFRFRCTGRVPVWVNVRVYVESK